MELTVKVGLGAALGSLARYGFTFLPGADMWAILAVNVIGCFAIAFFKPPPMWSTGFLGGFTTYSTYIMISLAAPWYFFATLAACIAAWLVGDYFAGMVADAERPHPSW